VAGYRVVVASNQAGVNRGAMTLADLIGIHSLMRAEADAAGGRIEAVFVCPHDWDEGCECRKPKPGLLLRAQRQFDLDLTRVLYVGDDERDEMAAVAAGCPFAQVTSSRSLLDLVRQLLAKSESGQDNSRNEQPATPIS
jgi:histidinol-phosphate phosphatase family protein